MVRMIQRYLTAALEEFCFSHRKIALVSGPRQCGKTTLAKALLRKRKAGADWTWDETKFRRIWAKDPSAVVPQARGQKVPLLVLDEIHKFKDWKNYLKGVYDTYHNEYQFLVLGSGRLDTFQKGGDSLAGRYFLFYMWPFSISDGI